VADDRELGADRPDRPTDYTDPATIDVNVVIGNITHAFRVRGHTWDDRPSWPNVTVMALAVRVEQLGDALREACDAITECTGPYVQDLIAGDLARWQALAGREPAGGGG
jgi:hypothetical protein